MTRPRLHLIHSAQPSQAPAQTSYSNQLRVVASKGRRRVKSEAEIMKAECPILWQRFVQEAFGRGPGARSDTAIAFGVTLQTACNWHEGVVGPMGHAVAHATRNFREEYDSVFCPEQVRRAA